MKTPGIILVLMIVFAFSPKIQSNRNQNKTDLDNEISTAATYSKKETVLLDYFFNNEWKKDSSGSNVRFHYTWEDKANSGFFQLGEIFRKNGMQTKSLESAPTKRNLKNASIYIIVDPDTEKETERPNYITQT